ncbi:MAG: flagellar assembly protein FliW [Candidatus Pelethousia sp.]|nr:flagellar assembly protein FliW [Candidatus Pelethousia sp.]
MIIETHRFGRVTINPDHIISFGEGLLGFEQLKRYAIILCEATEPIQWLQAVDDPTVSLPIINPFLIKPDYELDVDDAELHSIGTPSVEEILIVNAMVLPEKIREATVNLSAPVLINLRTKQGRQIVMEYSQANAIRYPAFEALAAYYREQEARKPEKKEQADVSIDQKT